MMTPRTILFIALACFALANIGYWHNHFRFNGRVAELHTRSSDSRSRSEDRVEPIRVPEANRNSQGIAGESPASPVLSEAEARAMAQAHRTNRTMPGVRTNEPSRKRFPLEEEQ